MVAFQKFGCINVLAILLQTPLHHIGGRVYTIRRIFALGARTGLNTVKHGEKILVVRGYVLKARFICIALTLFESVLALKEEVGDGRLRVFHELENRF